MNLLMKIYKRIHLRKLMWFGIAFLALNIFFMAFSTYGMKYILVQFTSATTSAQTVGQTISNGKYIKYSTDNIFYTEFYYGTEDNYKYYIMYSEGDDGYFIYFMDGDIDKGDRLNTYDSYKYKEIILRKTDVSNTNGIIKDILDNWDDYYSDYGFDREYVENLSMYTIGEIVYPPSGVDLVLIGAYVIANLLIIIFAIIAYSKSLSIDKDPVFADLMNSGNMQFIEADILTPKFDHPAFIEGKRFIILKQVSNLKQAIIDTEKVVWGYIHTQPGHNGGMPSTVLRLYYDGDKYPHDYPVQTAKTNAMMFVNLITQHNPEVIFRYNIELVKAWNAQPERQAFLDLFSEEKETTV